MRIAEKKGKPVGFRPVSKVQERLEYAEKIGVDVAQMMNDLVLNYGQTYLEKAKRNVQAALQIPVP